MTENTEDQILKNANSPKSAEVDGQKVEQHSLKDQIEADRYVAGKKALRKGLGIKITKMNSGGA